LTVPPPELGQLTQLEELGLGHNHLTAVPIELGRLSNLTVLDLSYNQLTTLPAELGRLTSLMELDLEGNPLAQPLADLVDQGTSAVLAYLQSLEAPTPPTGQAPDS
jgi:leucine-rich repeat protein SHOC2